MKKTQENLRQKYYTPHEVAALMGRDYPTVLRWCKLGYIPCSRIGKRYFVPIDKLEEMLQQESGQDDQLQTGL